MAASPKGPVETLMYAEAADVPATLERQLTDNKATIGRLVEHLHAHPPRFVVTCARGSSDHAATFAKYVIETQLGYVTASASLSVSSMYEAKQNLEGALYIALSQSGRSPDLVCCAEMARAAGAHVLALVNLEDSPLAAVADTVIPLRAGPEHSIAATKSYQGSLAAILHLVAHWKGDKELMRALNVTPDALHAAFRQDWSPLVDGLTTANNMFVLGRGFGLSAAQEAALKFKETCGLHAEAFSTAEVKHGPMALVDAGFSVLLFAQRDATLTGALETAREFRSRGARVWSVAPGDTHADALPIVPAPHPLCAPLLAIQSFYRAVNTLTLARGRNPDVSQYLNKITETI